MNELSDKTQAPGEVVIHAADMEIGFTPRELRTIREKFGRSWTQLVQDEETDDKFAAMAWLHLRREGYQIDLDAVDDVVIRIVSAPVDPTKNGPLSTLPGSAGSGG